METVKIEEIRRHTPKTFLNTILSITKQRINIGSTILYTFHICKISEFEPIFKIK